MFRSSRRAKRNGNEPADQYIEPRVTGSCLQRSAFGLSWREGASAGLLDKVEQPSDDESEDAEPEPEAEA